MHLQPRDKLILTLCYQHGFIAVRDLENFYASSSERRRRMAEYVHAGLTFVTPPPIPERRVIYRLTPKGAFLVESFYPLRIPQKKFLNPATYIHSTKVLEARLRIAPLWNGEWTPESLLPRASDEIPDGIVSFPSGKKVYVELENSLKSKKRFLGRLATFRDPIFTLYIATSAELERALQRYLASETSLPPAGVILLDDLRTADSSVWTPTKTLHPFSRRSY